MATFNTSNAGNTVNGVSINNDRRIYNFGDRVAELAPQESPFFAYLSQVAKSPTDDPVFKFLKQRHQWQRRNFEVKTQINDQTITAGTTTQAFVVRATYDKYGRPLATGTYAAPEFLLKNQVFVVRDADGTAQYWRITTDPVVNSGSNETTFTALALTSVASGANALIAAGNEAQVIGSSFAEGTGAPEGWADSLYSSEGYTQIFKTSVPLFSGTTLATRYRGRPDEYMRVWSQKMKEHKIDIEQAILFGQGSNQIGTETNQRYTWGILPYTQLNGFNHTFDATADGYDEFLEMMQEFFAPERANTGQKLVLASRKVMNYFQRLQTNSYLKNSFGTSSYQLDVQNVQGKFGHMITKIETMYGSLNFVMEPLLRGPFEDYAIAVDLANVAYRPLVGNGENRDTQIITNVQDNDADGRKDMILTEAGLEISLPETHGLFKFTF